MAQLKVEHAHFEKVQIAIRQMNEATKNHKEQVKKRENPIDTHANNNVWVECSIVLFVVAASIALARLLF